MSEATAASVYLITLWAAVGAAFLLSAAAAAFESYKPVEIQRIAEGGRTERQLEKLLQKRDQVDWSLDIGRILASLSVVACSAKLLTLKSADLIWLNVLFVTPIVLILCEIFPRLLGARFRHILAGRAVWILSTYLLLVMPIQYALRRVFNLLAQIAGLPDEQKEGGMVEEDLLGILDRGTETGVVDPKEIDLIESVLEMDDITVSRLMTPRPDIYALNVNDSWSNVLMACKSTEWSRIPVFEDRSDNIVGVLLVKDLLRAPQSAARESNHLRSIMLQPRFVPSSKTAEDMLAEFTDRKNHMAFVVDEHGTLVGLVTLDDLLDALVGNLTTGDPDQEIQHLRPDAYLVKATLDMEELSEQLGVQAPTEGHYNVGGFVFQSLGEMPKKDDTITWQGYRLTVAKLNGRRIEQVLIERVRSNREAI